MSSAPAQSAAGRAAQGAERRSQILAATVRILRRRGLAAVTHRRVAEEADVPLAATTYYFSSKDELVTEALAILVEDEIDRLSRRAAEMGVGPALTGRLRRRARRRALQRRRRRRARLLAQFEVYLEAARRPSLRATAAHWRRAFTSLAEWSLTQAGASEPARLAPLLVAGVDGILVHELSDGITGDGDLDRLRKRLEQLFTLLLER